MEPLIAAFVLATVRSAILACPGSRVRVDVLKLDENNVVFVSLFPSVKVAAVQLAPTSVFFTETVYTDAPPRAE
jgi:hypothetical protein